MITIPSRTTHFLRLFSVVCFGVLVGTSAPIRTAQAQSRPDTTRMSNAQTVSSRFSVALSQKPAQSPREVDAIRLKADTGRMVRGYEKLTSYTTPSMCWRAIMNSRRIAWKTGWHDTIAVAWTPEQDSFPSKAVTLARACNQQFSVDATALHYLRYAQMIALVAGDDVKAQAAAARRRSVAKTVVERKAALLDVLDGYTGRRGEIFVKGKEMTAMSTPTIGDQTNIKPLRIKEITAVIAALDSLGSDARFERAWAHRLLLEYYTWTVFDTAAMGRELAALRNLAPLFTQPDAPWVFNNSAYVVSSWLNTWNIASILALYRAGPATWGDSAKYEDIVRAEWMSQCKANRLVAHPDFLQATQGCTVAGPGLDVFLSLFVTPYLGKPAPRLQANYWFNAGTNPVRPVPGKVNFIVELYEFGWGRPHMPQEIAFLRRLQEKYGPDGLAVTVVQSTHGYAWNSDVLTPQQEADAYAWYYLDYWKMPMALAVVETPIYRDETGKKIEGQSSIKKQYPPLVSWLIDGNGKAIAMKQHFGEDDAVTEAFIRQALGL